MASHWLLCEELIEGTRGVGCSRPPARPFGLHFRAGYLAPLGSLPRANTRQVSALQSSAVGKPRRGFLRVLPAKRQSPDADAQCSMSVFQQFPKDFRSAGGDGFPRPSHRGLTDRLHRAQGLGRGDQTVSTRRHRPFDLWTLGCAHRYHRHHCDSMH
jgi:hypothetical protein